MNWRGISEIVMFLLIIALTLLCIHYCNRPAEQIIKTEIKTDTIVVRDTITKYLPSKTRTAYVRDTIIITDTIEMTPRVIPVVRTEYKDSDYQAIVSGGYFAEIEQISVYPKRIYVSTTTTDVVKRKPIVSVVAGVGVGYSDKIRPTIGVTIGVPVWNIYGKR